MSGLLFNLTEPEADVPAILECWPTEHLAALRDAIAAELARRADSGRQPTYPPAAAPATVSTAVWPSMLAN